MADRKSTAGHETWGDTQAAWGVEHGALVERFRALYLAELERFVEAIGPRLESGELGDYGPGGEEEAFDRLEDAIAEHFGLQSKETTENGARHVEGDFETAELIRLVSPAAEEDDTWGAGGDECGDATWCIALDVVNGWIRSRRAA